MAEPAQALSVQVRGVVQGVGFRPFVFRLALDHGLAGWVLNGDDGVVAHVEGPGDALAAFARDLRASPPPAAAISEIRVRAAVVGGFTGFEIRPSRRAARPTVRVSPDLPVCADCLAELFDPADRRYRYPYINCTNCGPRYSIVTRLPYDRAHTTMARWTMCAACRAEYEDPANRRFHAQPIACPACGPEYQLRRGSAALAAGDAAIRDAARALRAGAIVAVKGIGGYHLACDARQAAVVEALRERKFRKEKPFAVMARDLGTAARIVDVAGDVRALLESPARPIVLAPARVAWAAVAPGTHDLGVMLPYAPLHYLLFDAGAPDALVLTSANRSSEPIAYEDEDALRRLAGIADLLLVGERPIARRVDDSVARAGDSPAILRRSRGHAPGAAARLPGAHGILAVGADLKNTITVVVDGQAFVSQHIGDLDDHAARRAFDAALVDLSAMYEIDLAQATIAHDAHPQYVSTGRAAEVGGARAIAIQHHRAHVASVLAEHDALDTPCLGLAFDGTGYGDDGSIWGGEIFAGSVAGGFARVGHLRGAALPGGDAAARHPVQAAAGFLAQLDDCRGFTDRPFGFPPLFERAARLVAADVRCFGTTSAGRLFDTAAAVLGFTRPVSFEGQAAIWLEQLARTSTAGRALPFVAAGLHIDWRPALDALVGARRRGEPAADLARAFHRGLAHATADLVRHARALYGQAQAVAVSGGVFQNEVLLSDLRDALSGPGDLPLLLPRAVPPNDGGISLGQAALAATRAIR